MDWMMQFDLVLAGMALLWSCVNGQRDSNRSKINHPNAPGLREHTARPTSDGAAQVQSWIAEGRRIGVLIVSYRSRLCDFDNLALAGKPCIDALRYSGYLKDDDTASIEALYLQRPCPRKDEHTDIFMFPL